MYIAESLSVREELKASWVGRGLRADPAELPGRSPRADGPSGCAALTEAAMPSLLSLVSFISSIFVRMMCVSAGMSAL